MKDSSDRQNAQIGDDINLTGYFELLLYGFMGVLIGLLFILGGILVLPLFVWALVGLPFALIVYPFKKKKAGYIAAKVVGIIFVYPLGALLGRMGLGH